MPLLFFLAFFLLSIHSLQAQTTEPNYAVMKVVEENGASKLLLPLKKTSVRASVSDVHAVTDITQVYQNDTGKKIEIVYQFPLPHDGVVTDMVVQINERTIFGVIKEREAARKEFEEARAAGRTASLVEQERPNLFTQSIANILPNDEIKVTLRVFHPLSYSAGRFEYVFPITVGPRYMGGLPTGKSGEGWSPDTSQVPDASRVSPPYLPEGVGSNHFLDLDLTLETNAAVKGVRCTSHEVVVKKKNDRQYTVSLSPVDRIPNKDFILLYETESKLPQISLETNRRQGDAGYFSLTLIPPTQRDEEKIIPKEMIFVLDRSGSMTGAAITKAKEALVKSLKKLGTGDSFNIIAFDDKVERFWDKPKPFSAGAVMDAVRYVERLDARGGTEMDPPLSEALGYPADAKRQRIILFITDGNVGYEKQLINKARANLGNARIFAVGIGSSVNRYLVGELAREGKGTSEFIRQDEDVAVRLNSIFAKISSPVLTDVKIEFQGIDTEELYPEKARDLFFNEPTVILGRYKSAGDGAVVVTGRTASQTVTFSAKHHFPADDDSNPAIRYAWAKKKIDSLGLTAMGQETPELKKQITDLSIRYSILSPYTAFIAVERESREKTKTTAERWIIPSELPESLRYEGFGEEIQMKTSRIRPGDPVILVKAPENSKSVVAQMPTGEWLPLRYDKDGGVYSSRFAVPFGTKDGKYPIRVAVTKADGKAYGLKMDYTVDSKPPKLTVKSRLEGLRLSIEAVPEGNVFITDEGEVWPDVKEIVAILPDGTEVALKLDPRKKSRWIWKWEGLLPQAPAGRFTIVVKAVDYAGNWAEEKVLVER